MKPFTRLFPTLPSHKYADGQAEATAELFTITDDAQGESTRGKIGHVFVGQLIAHTHAFDASSISAPRHMSEIVSPLNPVMNLDSHYGRGPALDPYLYELDSGPNWKFVMGDKLKDESGRTWYDLPRNSQGVAIVPDKRNAETTVTAQFHMLPCVYHNKLIDAGATFDDARRETVHTWQYLVREDWLDVMCIPKWSRRNTYLTKAIKAAGPGPYAEFTGAVLRMHTQIPSKIEIREGKTIGMFDDAWKASTEFIDFDYMFGEVAQRPKKIAMAISAEMANMKPEPDGGRNIALRNIQRGQHYGLPSFNDVAEAIGFPASTDHDFDLWTGLLHEAQTAIPPRWGSLDDRNCGDGNSLGPVGSALMAGIINDLIESDPASYLCQRPNWKPEARTFMELVELVRSM